MFEPRYSLIEPDTYPTTKYESIFKNFDYEKMQRLEDSKEFINLFGKQIFSLVLDAIEITAYRFKDEDDVNLIKPKYIGNDGIRKIANFTHDCFNIGYLKDDGDVYMGFHSDQDKDWLEYVIYVNEGYHKAYEWHPIRPAQMEAICALFIVDSALSDIKEHGFKKSSTNKLLLANYFISSAKESDFQSLAYESFRVGKVQAAMTRYKNDPKQLAKSSVYEHWKQWQEDPKLYSTKADFARDMLDAYEVLTSQKKIEDWCRDWERKKGN